MASTTTMYRMPKLTSVPANIDLPSGMYRMDPLNKFANKDLASSYYGTTCETNHLPDSLGKISGLAELELRQEAVLQRLQNLKQQLDKLQLSKSSNIVDAIPAVGAAAQSSPVKQPIGVKQAVVEHILSALKDHLDDLSCLHFSSQNQDSTTQSDVGNLPRSILYRLGCLKEELSRLQKSKCGDEFLEGSEKSMGVSEQQAGLLKVIGALKEELLLIAGLQEEETNEEPVSEMDIVIHHREVVKKLLSLQIELTKLFRGLQDLSWETGSVHDLVISASPDRPPYSLVLLRKLLKDAGFPVYCSNHLHSSIKEVNESLQSMFCDNPVGDRAKHSMAFTLHWKDVSAPSLMVNPLRQTPISGEVNIVRYISRLFPLSSLYNYEATGTFTSITETDNLLDSLGSQMICGNNKERQAVLRQLNGRLGRKPWLMGDKCSIVDVMAWSAIRQTGVDSGAPSNVSKWYKAMSALIGLESSSLLQENKNISASKSVKSVPGNSKSKPEKVKTISVSSEANNGLGHVNRDGLEHLLKKLNINYQVQNHEEVFTVEALMRNVSNMPGLHMKNLFLKDKKKNFYMISARHDAEVKLNEVGKNIGVKDLRFGDESVMFDIIGVKQGCVTAYALLNDKKHQVKLLLDSEAFNEKHPYVNFHPVSNAATLGVSPADLKKFLNHTGHEPTLLTFK